MWYSRKTKGKSCSTGAGRAVPVPWVQEELRPASICRNRAAEPRLLLEEGGGHAPSPVHHHLPIGSYHHHRAFCHFGRCRGGQQTIAARPGAEERRRQPSAG